MDIRITDAAARIRGLRDMMDFTAAEMAAATGVDEETYMEYESGGRDLSFSFVYKCADKFGVDITDLLTGDTPKLDFYSIVRSGEGLEMKRRGAFSYRHMAYLFKQRTADPFIVTAPYSQKAESEPIELSYHAGQEMDFILKGSLRMRFEDHEELLREGDFAYYDSSRGHGMIAAGGQDCVFLAIVLKP